MDKLRIHTNFERGQGIVEYAIILVLIAVVVIAILLHLGPAVGNVFSRITVALQNPQKYAEIMATQDIAIITDVSVKRKGEDSLAVYVNVSEPIELTAVTSDGKSAGAKCVESCVIEISGVSASSGTVTVSSPEASSVLADYPSKIVSALQEPKNIAVGTGTISVFVLVVYTVKSVWWKIGLKLASQCATFGKADAALKIFQQLIASGKASDTWTYLINAELLIKNAKPEDLLSFYKLACDVAQHLSRVAELESLTKLGGLYNRLGSFDNALPTLKSAEKLLYLEGVQNVEPKIQLELLSGIGIAHIHTGGDRIANLRWAGDNLNRARDIAIEIADEEARKTIEKEAVQIGKGFSRIRRKQNAWGFAIIEEYEDDHLLYLDETYTLTTGMGWGDAPAAYKKAAPILLPESLESFEFDISVWAEDMEIEPLWIRTLELDPTSDLPSLVHFELTPKAVGPKVIKVDFYYQLHWLQQITLEVEVVESPLTMPDITDEAVLRAQPLKVGMLLGLGGLGDKSFNDSAYAGLEEARQQHGIEFETADSGTPEESIALLQQWAEADYDLIIALGFHNGPTIAQVAESFPEKRFAIIDTEVKGENVWSAVFREYEADYVVGALAALIAGKEGRVGFIGGVKTPIIHRIKAAFSQGIERVNPDTTLNTIYVDKFDDEVMGQYFAEILYAMGAGVIYQAAGRSGMGAIRAAKKLGKLIISTGGDHSELAPDAVLTSRVKNVGRPVLDVIKAAVEDQFEGGKTASYGLANKGVSLTRVRPEVVKRLVERLPPYVTLDDLITRMKEVTEAVASGQIVVDFDEVEGTIPESVDGQSFDERLPDETPNDKSAGGKSLDEKLMDGDDGQHST